MSAKAGPDHGHPTANVSPPRPPAVSPLIPNGPAVPSVPSSETGPQPPPSEPVSELENPDAIALRSTISILQIQREQSKADLRRLEQLKHAAVANAEAYKDDLIAGRIQSGPGSKSLLGPEIGDVSSQSHAKVAEDQTMRDADEESSEAEGDEIRNSPRRSSQFGDIPTPQNVIRCPPVNWAKYHVVGESLDKLHAEQRLRPAPGQPQYDSSAPVLATRAPEAVIAAPYRPLVDKVPPEPMKTRSGGKRN
ncbi:MAG: hypothetical protein M4579_001463 [Chaenotheca gracillima]|nr:MAG: hypothetical protein M4579_001463 [Chaenotheca gracillima]